jgi:hypothetical protein
MVCAFALIVFPSVLRVPACKTFVATCSLRSTPSRHATAWIRCAELEEDDGQPASRAAASSSPG